MAPNNFNQWRLFPVPHSIIAPVILYADHDISPLLLNKLILELEVRVNLVEVSFGHPAGIHRGQTDPLDQELSLALSQLAMQNSGRSEAHTIVSYRWKGPWSCQCLAMELLEQTDMEHVM
jgi:hypothetical protein